MSLRFRITSRVALTHSNKHPSAAARWPREAAHAGRVARSVRHRRLIFVKHDLDTEVFPLALVYRVGAEIDAVRRRIARRLSVIIDEARFVVIFPHRTAYRPWTSMAEPSTLTKMSPRKITPDDFDANLTARGDRGKR
jgi:hypothetical protein